LIRVITRSCLPSCHQSRAAHGCSWLGCASTSSGPIRRSFRAKGWLPTSATVTQNQAGRTTLCLLRPAPNNLLGDRPPLSQVLAHKRSQERPNNRPLHNANNRRADTGPLVQSDRRIGRYVATCRSGTGGTADNCKCGLLHAGPPHLYRTPFKRRFLHSLIFLLPHVDLNSRCGASYDRKRAAARPGAAGGRKPLATINQDGCWSARPARTMSDSVMPSS